MIAIYLSRQEALGTDPKGIQQISFPVTLEQAEYATIFFIIEEAKESILGFSKWTVRAL